jgi:uncharacterized protein involved in exopolysaccharide biosynthesis
MTQNLQPPQPYGPESASQSAEEEINLLDLFIALAKHKRRILGFTLLVAVLAMGISFFLPPIYTASAKIIPPQQGGQSSTAAILSQMGGMGGMGGVAGAVLGVKSPGEVYVAILKSRTVADNLIQRFGLMETYKVEVLTDARKRLERSSKIASSKTDGTIAIEVDDPDPKRAALLANGYVEELYKLSQTLAVTEASQRRLFFEKQLKQAKENLADAEVAMKSLQEATGLFKLDDQGRAILETFANLKAQVAAKEVALGSIRLFATETNPDLVRTQRELTSLREQLAKLEKSGATNEFGLMMTSGKLPEAGLEYVRKFRDVKYHETIFDLLARQYEMAKVDEARDTLQVQVLDKALPPERKSKPPRIIIVMVSTLAAFMLAVGIALVAESFQKMQQDPVQAGRFAALRENLTRR